MRGKRKILSGRIKLGIKYVLALVLLAVVLSTAQLEATWQALSTVDPLLLGGALVAMTAVRWLGAFRSGTLAAAHDLRFPLVRMFEISCVSTLYGLALPGALSGGIVRWHLLGKPDGRHSDAAALIIFERMLCTLVLALLGVVGWLLDPRLSTGPLVAWLLVLVAAGALAAGLVSVSVLPEKAASWLAARRRQGLLEKPRAALEKALVAAARHRNPMLALRVVAISVAVHLTAAFGLYLIALALGLDVGFVTCLWLRACIMLVTAAPLTPAGLGVRELSTVFLLTLIGIGADEAVALSLLQFAMILFFAGVGALFECRDHFLKPASRQADDADMPARVTK